MIRLASLATALLIAAQAGAADAPRPAAELIGEARARAEAEGRSVMVAFHASWCGYCRLLERWMALPDVKQALEASFEIVWLDVLERGARVAQENPGGREAMANLGGSGGLPFVAFLDASGTVVTSNEGVGYPVSAEELDRFMTMLATASPRLSEEDLGMLRARLTEVRPRRRSPTGS